MKTILMLAILALSSCAHTYQEKPQDATAHRLMLCESEKRKLDLAAQNGAKVQSKSCLAEITAFCNSVNQASDCQEGKVLALLFYF